MVNSILYITKTNLLDFEMIHRITKMNNFPVQSKKNLHDRISSRTLTITKYALYSKSGIYYLCQFSSPKTEFTQVIFYQFNLSITITHMALARIRGALQHLLLHELVCVWLDPSGDFLLRGHYELD